MEMGQRSKNLDAHLNSGQKKFVFVAMSFRFYIEM